jgi:hypothetical protein
MRVLLCLAGRYGSAFDNHDEADDWDFVLFHQQQSQAVFQLRFE